MQRFAFEKTYSFYHKQKLNWKRSRYFSTTTTTHNNQSTNGNSASQTLPSKSPFVNLLFENTKANSSSDNNNNNNTTTATSTVEGEEKYLIKLSPLSDKKRREEEWRNELDRRYPNNEWVSEPLFPSTFADFNNERKVLISSTKPEEGTTPIDYSFDEWLHKRNQQRLEHKQQLADQRMLLQAQNVQMKMKFIRDNDKDYKDSKHGFRYFFSRLILNSPLGIPLVKLAGFKDVILRSPPNKITPNSILLDSTLIEPPTIVKLTEFESVMREYRKIWGFPKEKRLPTFNPDEVDDPSRVDLSNEDAVRNMYAPFKGRMKRGNRMRLKHRHQEEWEREEELRGVDEAWEKNEVKQVNARVRNIGNLRREFERNFPDLISGKEPPKEEDSEETKAEQAKTEEEAPKEEEAPVEEIPAEELEGKTPEEIEQMKREAEEFRLAQEERNRKKAEKEGKDEVVEDAADAELNKSWLWRKKMQQKDHRIKDRDRSIRELLAKQDRAHEDRRKGYNPATAVGFPIDTRNFFSKWKSTIKQRFNQFDRSVTNWAKKVNERYHPPPAPLSESEAAAREKQLLEEEEDRKQDEREMYAEWGFDWTKEENFTDEQRTTTLANARMRHTFNWQRVDKMIPNARKMLYFQRLYGYFFSYRYFFHKLRNEILRPFVLAHLNKDDDALNLLCSAAVHKHLLLTRVPGYTGACKVVKIKRLKISRPMVWVQVPNYFQEDWVQHKMRHNDTQEFMTKQDRKGMAMKYPGDVPSVKELIPFSYDDMDTFIKRQEKLRTKASKEQLMREEEERKKERAEAARELGKEEEDDLEDEDDDDLEVVVDDNKDFNIRDYEEDGFVEVGEKEYKWDDYFKSTHYDENNPPPEIAPSDYDYLDSLFSEDTRKRLEQERKDQFPKKMDPAHTEKHLLDHEIWTEEKNWTEEEINEHWKKNRFGERLFDPLDYSDMRYKTYRVPLLRLRFRVREQRRTRADVGDEVLYSGAHHVVLSKYNVTLMGPMGMKFGSKFGWKVIGFHKFSTRRRKIP